MPEQSKVRVFEAHERVEEAEEYRRLAAEVRVLHQSLVHRKVLPPEGQHVLAQAAEGLRRYASHIQP